MCLTLSDFLGFCYPRELLPFMSLVATTRQLEISFFEYVRDRISQLGNIPSLATIIREKSVLNPFGLSWMPE